MSVNEARGFRSAVAVVDADVCDGRRGEDLTLIFEAGIGLNDGDREVTGGVRLQAHVP